MWDTSCWNIVVMLVGFPMFLIVLFLFTHYCNFQSNPRGRQTTTVGADVQMGHVRSHHVLFIAEDEQPWRRRSLVLGLRDEVINYSCPKFPYSASTRFDEEDNACCSICLGEYEEGEMLRLLPECGHRFHLVCADTWLRINRSCPICRTFAVKKPVQTLPLNS